MKKTDVPGFDFMMDRPAVAVKFVQEISIKLNSKYSLFLEMKCWGSDCSPRRVPSDLRRNLFPGVLFICPNYLNRFSPVVFEIFSTVLLFVVCTYINVD